MTWTRHQTLQAQPLWTHTHAPTPMQPNQQPADVHKAFPSAVATAHLASCPRGKWPCRAALSNAPIYREPKEHFSASSPCQPLSRAVGWPETPSPSSFSQEGPLTLRPTPGQRCAESPPTASVCLDTLWVRHAKGILKELTETISNLKLC